MTTRKIYVNSRGEGFKEALSEASSFAEAIGLNHKAALRTRLLAEETLGMVRAITGIFEAEFWLEQAEDGTCRLHLEAETAMDLAKKEELLDVSTRHENIASKGFMGKILELIETGLYEVNEIGRLQAHYGSYPIMYGEMGSVDIEAATIMNSYVSLWSMKEYRDNIVAAREENPDNPAMEAAWDELEKSIVASIADEVRVGVRGNKVEMVIEKKPSQQA